MRSLGNKLLLLCLLGCGKKKDTCDITHWQSKYSNQLEFNCGTITYKKVSNGCEIYGTYKKTYDNFLTWSLVRNTCTTDLETEIECYFAVSATQEHGNFVCFDLGIKEAFYLF